MRLFTDDDFQFGLEIVLGGAYRQASDVGEALATAERIPDGDADAWISEWRATADGAWGAGETARHAGRRVTALSFYRRAATYYATALYWSAKAKRVWARSRARHLAPSPRVLGARGRPLAGPRRAHLDPLRGHGRCVGTSFAHPTRSRASAGRW